MADIKKIEPLLKREGLTGKKLEARLRLLTSLDHAVIMLLEKIPQFKGIEVYGSVLNRNFNGKSDIDFCTVWKNYTPNRIKNWAYTDNKTIQGYVRDYLRYKSKRRTHDVFSITEENIDNISKSSIVLNAIFGVFLGDNVYISQLRTRILKAIKESGKITQWSTIQNSFNKCGHKDLSNSNEGYKLSNFSKFENQYL